MQENDVTMTRQEMIRMAEETRKHVTNAPVPEELLRKYPADVRKVSVPGREGSTVKCFAVYNPDRSAHADTLIINYHGGGFIRGRTANDEVFCRRIANLLSCRVLDVDYKIAPDYPFPVAVHESYDVAVWAYTHAGELGVDPGKIVLLGHSAGGNLATTVQMKLLEEGSTFHPALLVLDYPPLDLYTDPADKKQMGQGIPAERARRYNLFYCDRKEQKNPYVSPYYAPDAMLTGFPKTLIITAGTDDLCNEAEEFGRRLAGCGSEVTMKRFQGAKHGFTIYRTQGSEGALELITRFIRDGLAAGEHAEGV